MAQSVWDQFASRMLRVAQRKLGGARGRRVADEEDVALSAFESFCAGVEAGRFHTTEDKDELWPLLKVITERKAIDYLQHERRLKRGGGQVRGESALDAGADTSAAGGFGQIGGDQRSPLSEIQAKELYEQLLEVLDDETLCSIAVWKMEGYTNEEIAELLSCSRSTVVRKLEVIRTIWGAQFHDE